MTHPPDVIRAAEELRESGFSPSEIARCIGVPRRTVADWAAGRLPRSGRSGGCKDCGGAPHTPDALPPAYVYLLGLYLGDGYIAEHRRAVYKLRITLDAAYPRIVDECAAAMHAVLPNVKVARFARSSGDIEVYAYSRAWPCLFPQHGPGKKHLRSVALEPWQWDVVRREPRLMLKGLIHSDGCRFMNTGRNWAHPRYTFSNLSVDIKEIFRATCDLVGVHSTTAGNNTVYVSRKHDVALLDEFIGPKA